MFHKLKIRFLILNLIIITVLMLVSFASIYFIMYQNIQSDINLRMHSLMETRDNDVDDEKRPLRHDKNKVEAVVDDSLGGSMARAVSFVVITDQSFNTISKSTVSNLDETFMENAKNTAVSQQKEQGIFELNGGHWKFQMSFQHGQYKMAFLDITSQAGLLKKLIYAFIMVAVIMFILIYFISWFFAQKSIRPIEESFEKQKQFVANASHELKTPLTVINTNVDLLISNGEDSFDHQLKWLKYIKSESERMAKLISNLLYLAKVDYSHESVILARIDLSQIAEELILTMEGVLYERDIVFRYVIDPGIIIYANQDQIREVLSIILDNAIKYTQVSGKIEVTCKRENNMPLITISNTGDGIPAEDLHRIFDRFYRVDQSHSRSTGGFGLGLSIAQIIVKQHKGKIYASSADGITTFTVELPIVK